MEQEPQAAILAAAKVVADFWTGWFGLAEIRKLRQKRLCMLYLVCENGPKIPVGTCFFDLQGKPVQKSAATLAAARIAG